MFKGIGAIILVIVAFIVLSVGILFVSGEISILTAPFRGEVEKHEQVEADGNYVVSHYDEFHQKCNAFQAKNEEIELAEQTLEGDKKAEVIYAHQQAKAEIAAEYNAMANEVETAGQFRDKSLPPHLDADDEDVDCG